MIVVRRERWEYYGEFQRRSSGQMKTELAVRVEFE